ncbi:hypothetical protein BC332_07952 [Capsicum chinense]|nr:hypothetical protein BC332_07952 [Capsicum chinense]
MQGGVGILHKNLTLSSSSPQGLLRKLGAGLDNLPPSSAMGSASSSHRSGWLKKILAGLRANAHLLTIEYMDLAEQSLQALKKISQVYPSVCLWAGTLMAMLSYLKFFSTRIQCKEKYDLKLEKLVSEFDNSSSEAKLESPRLQLAQWLQNDMLRNDSNVTSLSQIKDQGFLQHKTQELRKKWKDTCLQLQPTSDNV